MSLNFLVILFVCGFGATFASVDYAASLNDQSIYYDVKSHKPFRMISIENNLVNGSVLSSFKATSKRPIKDAILRRITYRSNGCTCQELTCGCCAGMNLNQFNFNREGCMNFTYDPQEFAINMNMLMDQNSIYSNSLSAKYPPPLCIPLPIPYLPVSVEACAKLFDVYTPGQNLHMCFDLETRIQRATVFILHFDCMRMGNDGLALLKPDDMGGLPSSTPSSSPGSQVDSDIYDEVTEIKYKQR